jgi:hypothetical protein
VPDWEPISLERVEAFPLKERTSKVQREDFAKPWKKGGNFKLWIDSLPRILAAGDFSRVVGRILEAHASERMIILAMGAHAIKVGLNPVIIDLMERGLLKALSMNGAGVIHDTELAMAGQTSEDVAAQLGRGRFGMAEEPARLINEAITEGADLGLGLGKAVGSRIARADLPHKNQSLLGRAFELGIPVTVHVAIGTDTIHFHPGVDGSAVGKTSHLDFRIFSTLISKLEGGVFINLGSAVILPEVFLKALSLVRNLGYEVKKFTTLNMDFIRHYRPLTNVVQRPTLEGGEGYSLTGHHEIMFPLLAAALIEGIEEGWRES